MTQSVDRRHLLRLGGAFSVLGTAAPFALQLAAASSAAAQSAPDYKALVCVFLTGGNDSNNTVLATDSDSWGRYVSARGSSDSPIALMPPGTAPTVPGQVNSVTGRTATASSPEAWGGVLPITPKTAQAIPAGTKADKRTFALHPYLGPVKTMFDQGRLAIVANVGTLLQPTTKAQYLAKASTIPPNLFSHNDQQSTWQANAQEGVKVGWGGRMADMLASMNGQNTMFTAISTASRAVFLSGQSIAQYQLGPSAQPAVLFGGAQGSSLFGANMAPTRVHDLVTDTNLTNNFAADYATMVNRSMSAATTLNSAFAQPIAKGVAAPPAFMNPMNQRGESNALATQLQSVARMIAASATLGVRRQVFLVNLAGFDTHSDQNQNHPVLLAKLAHALAYFDSALANIGGIDRRNQVTTFTASDFSRSFTTNSNGSDHAWGGHHFVMGGAVRGGDIYGQYPTLGVDINGFNNPDAVSGALIPTTSVDQYGATLGRWFGVSDSDLDTVFPRLKTFDKRNLGFV